MIFALIAVSLGLLYLPIFFYRQGRRLPPRDWSRMTTTSLVAGASALLVSLSLIAAPHILRALGAGELAELCDELLGHVPHGTPLTGVIAASVLFVSILSGALTKFRTERTLSALTVEPFVGIHIPTPNFDLVFLPSQQRLAYSRKADPPQVVVTDGLVESLSPDEFRILLRHELAHIRYSHERDLQLLALIRSALRWLPGLSRSVSIARLAMERLADEEAAGPEPAFRRALSRALMATAAPCAPDAAPAFNHVEGLRERLSAMNVPAPPLAKYQRFSLRFIAATMRIWVGASGALGVMLLGGVCLG